MILSVPDEDMTLSSTEIVRGEYGAVGLKLELRASDEITLWFENKASLDQWLSDQLYKVQQSGV